VKVFFSETVAFCGYWPNVPCAFPSFADRACQIVQYDTQPAVGRHG